MSAAAPVDHRLLLGVEDARCTLQLGRAFLALVLRQATVWLLRMHDELAQGVSSWTGPVKQPCQQRKPQDVSGCARAVPGGAGPC